MKTMKRKFNNFNRENQDDDLDIEERVANYVKKLADQKENENILKAIEIAHKYELNENEIAWICKRFGYALSGN